MSSSTAPQRGTATARTLSVLSRPVPEFGGETARSLFDRQAGDSPAAATGTLNTRTAGKVAAEPARHGTSAGEQERCPGNGSGKRASADGASALPRLGFRGMDGREPEQKRPDAPARTPVAPGLMERNTGFEPATFALARRRSTS